MKKSFLFFVLTVLITVFLCQGCDPPSTVSYPPGIIKGIVYDSSNYMPIDSVYVISIPSGNPCYTDSAGRFRITNVQMPSSGVNGIIIASKKDYNPDTVMVWVLSNDSIFINMTMMPNHGVLIRDNFELQQYNSQLTYSSLDLFKLSVVQGQNDYRDIDFRDSMGLGQKFRFVSSLYDPVNFSFDSKFANSLGNFSKYDFDTLRMIYGLGGPLTDNYFQLNSTPFFGNPLVENSVYPFYLNGRFNLYPGSPKIYGLMYIKAIWFDPGSNSTFIRIDIKENRNGQNYFIAQ